MTKCYEYSLFGLGIRSEIELPELAVADLPTDGDVRIELGPVPDPPDPSTEYWVDESGACLSIPGVARFQVVDGSRIVVQPASGAPIRNVRIYLLGSAMGLLLHRRGDLPLHANAVEIGGRAFAFMGRSGAGKSTLAAAFHDRGYRVIADDVCVIRFDSLGGALACPGIPRLRLWEEALAATGRMSHAYELSFAGDENFRKFDVPVPQRGVAELPLAAVYQLATGNSVAVRRLGGSEAAEAIFANTYRGQYVRSAGNPHTHWSASLGLISSTPIFELSRPWDLNGIADHLAGIISHAENVIRSTARTYI